MLQSNFVRGISEIEDQEECTDCIRRKNWYFSSVDTKSGMCCSESEYFDSDIRDDCDLGGLNTVGRSQLKYFTCPTGRYCNAVKLRARLVSQIYRLDTNDLDDELICNHHIIFGIEAGFNDKIKLRFL